MKAWNKKHPEWAKLRRKAWLKNNPEKAAQYQKAWLKKNPEKIQLYQHNRLLKQGRAQPSVFIPWGGATLEEKEARVNEALQRL